MTFKALMAADVSAVFLNADEFAEEITWTPAGGSARTITAVVDRQDVREEDQQDGRVLARRASIHASADAAAGVGTTPGMRDIATFDSLAWAVDSISGPAEGIFRIDLIWLDVTRKSQRELRPRR